jgi:hypothetical protein
MLNRYTGSIVCGVALIALLTYLGFAFSIDSGIPEVVPANIVNQHMDVHAITASALQENANLLITISLALGALYSFGVSKNFEVENSHFFITLFLTVIFGVCLTFVVVYAFGVYHNIAIQTDRGVFFPENIESLLSVETRWTFACAALTVIVFCWRCTKVSTVIVTTSAAVK